jgi:hypothetical protein
MTFLIVESDSIWLTLLYFKSYGSTSTYGFYSTATSLDSARGCWDWYEWG